MYLTNGTYSTPNNSSWFSLNYAAQVSPRGKKILERQRWTIHTILQSTSQGALTTLIQAHEAGMRQENVDLTFYEDDGTETAHKIVNANTVNGVTFRGISYPGYLSGFSGSGSEYADGSAAFRYVVTQHEADVLSVEDNILFLSHQFEYSLGGYDYVFQQGLAGVPRFHITGLQTAFWAVQSGVVIGMYEHPNPPASLVSAPMNPFRSRVKHGSPQNWGRRRNWGYPTMFTYYFESAAPLIAKPTETV